jgi:hypothetical protein
MLDPLRIRTVLAAALLLTACLPAAEPRLAQESSSSPTDAEHLAALIARLGSSRYEEREAASQALEALGPPALGPLRKALPGPDAEVRRRAAQLVQTIERRLETAHALEPTRLRLVYRDTPLREAVADFARKTGFVIQLEGDRAKVAERRVTLYTGDVTLWEAVTEFCQKAGLIEGGSRPAMSLEDRYRSDLRDTRVFMLGDISGEDTAGQERRLLLKVAPAQVLPTFLAGALRMRALPPDTPLPGPSKATGETLFGLDVRLEPRLQLQSVLAVRIDRAVDDKGQILSQPEASSFSAASGTEILIVWDGFMDLPANLLSSSGQVPVRLRLAGQPSKRLKELDGAIALRALTAPEPLVTVDNVLQAAGQSVKGDDGSTVRPTEIQHQGDGQIKLQVEVAPAPRDLILDGLPARVVMAATRGVRRGPVPGMLVPPAVAAAQLALLDAKGRKIPLVDSSSPALSADGKTWEFTLLYRPSPGQGEPSRLIYTGRRCATVEVPFSLKDIPLP